MNHLNPEPPFIWPVLSVLDGRDCYEHQPPYSKLAMTSHAVFGIMSAPTVNSIEVLADWLEQNPILQIRLIVAVYPACATRQEDLRLLCDIANGTSDRLKIRIWPLQHATDRATNALCFLVKDSGATYMVTGPNQDFGLSEWQAGCVDFVFPADFALVDAFRCYFDELWQTSKDVTTDEALQIPDLMLPKGTVDGAWLWQNYLDGFHDDLTVMDPSQPIMQLESTAGDAALQAEERQQMLSPTEEIGLAKSDELAEWIARLYARGWVVSIDKLSRIPPLDAPLDPRWFGDAAEVHLGNVTRKVSMRVSVIDEGTLREIEKRRKGLRVLLTKFTFGLSDNMRWMPLSARSLFEAQLTHLNEEGQKLIRDLLHGDVDTFIKTKRNDLINNINAMYSELGRTGQVTEDVITRVSDSLRERLTKAGAANFLPTLSYSRISLADSATDFASPWGQAFSLLADVATFPREALTNPFFFRGLKIDEDALLEAMNVADDALCGDLRARGIRERCRVELDLLGKIEVASLEARERCELVRRLLSGEAVETIEETLNASVPA